MGSRYDFRCFSASGGSLCYNNGSCAINPIECYQYCQCPTGWTGERLIFHQRNCTMPTYGLLILLVLVFVLTGFGLMFLIRVRAKAKGKAKALLIRACLHSVLLCAYVLAIYLENGTYTASLVILGAVFLANSAWGLAAAEFLAIPVLMQVQAQRHRQSFMRVIFGTMVTVNTALVIAMAVTSSQGDDGIYNATATAYVFTIFLMELLNSMIIVYFGQELKRRLRESFAAKNEETEQLFLHLAKKVYTFQLGAILRPTGQLPLVLGGLFYSIVGNASFFWILYALLLILQGPSLAQVTLGIFHKHGHSKESEQVSDRKSHHSKIIVSASENTM